VVRVEDEKRGYRGTGFFVAPGRVVTCGHVVHGTSDLYVVWEDERATVTDAPTVPPRDEVGDPATYPLPDLALLSIDTAALDAAHPCVRLSTDEPATGRDADELYAAGFALEHAELSLTGAMTKYESPIEEGAIEFYKLKEGQIRPGYSGAPLLNLRTSGVSGVIESTRDRSSAAGSFAVSVSTLLGAFPELEEANIAFHASDARWSDTAIAEAAAAAERTGARGRLGLEAPAVEAEWTEELSPASALRPRRTLVPYVGRERLLADIAAWCETESSPHDPVALWFVTGGGGFGKTRLAIEACLEAERRGWAAGLLRPDLRDSHFEALAEWPGPLLIAIDYAETRPAVVGRLVAEVLARAPRSRVRIMLLVRRRASRAMLIEDFNEHREERLDSLLRHAPLSLLERREEEVDRLQLLDRGVEEFARIFGTRRSDRPRPRLQATHFARPLYVLVAAFLLAKDPELDVDELDERALLRTLLREHEADHWDRWAKRRNLELDREDQRVGVGLATLLTAADENEALTVVGLMPHMSDEPSSRRIAVARWLASLYAPEADDRDLRIAPLEPDRLGEVLVADILGERPKLLEQAADGASTGQLVRLLTVATRIARDDGRIREQLRVVLDERLADVLGRGLAEELELVVAVLDAMSVARPTAGAFEAADRFPDALPIWLRGVAATVTALAVEGLRASGRESHGSEAELARMLNNLANRLSEAGRRDAALTTAEEAVTLRRQLADANRSAFLPDLAASLNNLATYLSETGRRDEALTIAEEAVSHYRQLADANRSAFLPNLAASLNNLANRLSEAGRRDEALTIGEEAVSHYRQLADANRSAFLPDLAASLNNLANRLSEASRRHNAEQVFEAVLEDVADSALGTGLVRLARARWRLQNDESAAAVDDLAASADALEDAGDFVNRGEARLRLRDSRRSDPIRFDASWRRRGRLPLWLEYLEDDENLVQRMIEWIATPDWGVSRSYLADHADELLTDAAEATLEHLIDANPRARELPEHLDLLRTSRADGLDTAYDELGARRSFQRALSIVLAWVETTTWESSKAFAEGTPQLLSTPARAVLEAIARDDPRQSTLRLHRGLLALAVSDGVEAAYELRANRAARRTAIGAAANSESSDRLLALARLRSGIETGDPEAHFLLATVAASCGEGDEAEAAIADCADHAAPYERRDFATRLENLAVETPALASEFRKLAGLLTGEA
jgi:tetratricopeptide (TPR) repeat protein